jgi:ribose 5-phosphate isomerase A
MKRHAAIAAAGLVGPGTRLGLGSGSTAEAFIEALAERFRGGELPGLCCVSSSTRTARLAARLELPVATLAEVDVLDLTVDGADEVDGERRLLKGQGGAFLREKILAEASSRYVIVIDRTKLVDRLGSRHPVPVEVLPFAAVPVSERIRTFGAMVTMRERAGRPWLTDQKNLVLDCRFGPIADPEGLAARLSAVAGVLGHGLFLGFPARVLVGHADGVQEGVRG